MLISWSLMGSALDERQLSVPLDSVDQLEKREHSHDARRTRNDCMTDNIQFHFEHARRESRSSCRRRDPSHPSYRCSPDTSGSRASRSRRSTPTLNALSSTHLTVTQKHQTAPLRRPGSVRVKDVLVRLHVHWLHHLNQALQQQIPALRRHVLLQHVNCVGIRESAIATPSLLSRILHE